MCQAKKLLKMPQVPSLALIRRVVLASFTIGSILLRHSTSHFKDNDIGHTQNLAATGDTVDTIRLLRGQQEQEHGRRKHQKSAARFGLAVAHCEEDYLTWVDDVNTITIPGESGRQQATTWDTVVYERCGQNASESYSQWQRNIGSEECSAYLKYIVDRYDDLPEIVYFLQPDALRFNSVMAHDPHTSFTSLQELVAASYPLMMTPPQASESGSTTTRVSPDASMNGFLSLGNKNIDQTRLVQREGPNNNPVEIIDMMKERAPSYDEETMLHLVPGACFAVRRERILAHPPEYYKDLMLAIVARENVKWTCYSLEATWHVIFGEGLAIPPTSTITYHQEEGIFAV